MASYSYNSNSSSGSDISRLFGTFSQYPDGFNGVSRGGSASPQSLVLDSEKGELVKAPGRVGTKGASEAKALASLKNHSDAERRRRERINGHLTTLRGLVPCTDKMDKAALLAEVIREVKELKKTAVEESKGFLIPMDVDEVKVEPYDEGGDGRPSYKASVCCDYRPELLSELRQALDALQVEILKAEISTLEGRVKSAFVFTCCKGCNVCLEKCQRLVGTVHQALSNVLEKTSASLEYSPRTSLPGKRRRICLFDTSTSCSCSHTSCLC
ncbi:Transcription factor [Quillaja saponaria]|uniref:Transcription factor n=1 Tax=Quillaja saponaria TaxID=32244 RepID=A0AAD7KW00_QUISA|nr:Transcription factor [Quillaja saponaria]